jgi:hypothetical protein
MDHLIRGARRWQSRRARPCARAHTARPAAGELAGVLQLLGRVFREDPHHVEVSRLLCHLGGREPSPVSQGAVCAVSVEKPGDHVGMSHRTCGMQR